MYTSLGVSSHYEVLPDNATDNIQPISVVVLQPQQNQQSQRLDLTNPSVFFQYCIPLQNGKFTYSYPSLQQMMEMEKKEIFERPKRAQGKLICFTIILIGCLFGAIYASFFAHKSTIAILFWCASAIFILILIAHFKTACIKGHIKHAADMYYGREIVGIFFDINDNTIKRIRYKCDYGMTRQLENEPLESRASYLHEPRIKILDESSRAMHGPQRICRFSQLKNIGWQIIDGGSGPNDNHLVLQYNTIKGDDYRKYKINDYNNKENLMRGYNKLKQVMINVNPTWFSSGQCVDKGEKKGSWRGGRRY